MKTVLIFHQKPQKVWTKSQKTFFLPFFRMIKKNQNFYFLLILIFKKNLFRCCVFSFLWDFAMSFMPNKTKILLFYQIFNFLSFLFGLLLLSCRGWFVLLCFFEPPYMLNANCQTSNVNPVCTPFRCYHSAHAQLENCRKSQTVMDFKQLPLVFCGAQCTASFVCFDFCAYKVRKYCSIISVQKNKMFYTHWHDSTPHLVTHHVNGSNLCSNIPASIYIHEHDEDHEDTCLHLMISSQLRLQVLHLFWVDQWYQAQWCKYHMRCKISKTLQNSSISNITWQCDDPHQSFLKSLIVIVNHCLHVYIHFFVLTSITNMKNACYDLPSWNFYDSFIQQMWKL